MRESNKLPCSSVQSARVFVIGFCLAASLVLFGLELLAQQQSSHTDSVRAATSGMLAAGTNYSSSATIKGEALDEPNAGKTLRGTPVNPRVEYCYPAEPRDLFWQMDKVADAHGELQPLDFDENGDKKVDNSERDAIRGRNTWLLWGGGNEAFWGWLQEEGYGLTDFLILMDSRRRGSRFETAGLINQPGFETSSTKILGLYLDAPKKDGSAILRPPQAKGNPTASPSPNYNSEPEPESCDAQGRQLAEPVRRPTLPPNHKEVERTEPFPPWATSKEEAESWEKQKAAGKVDGEDPWKDYVPETVRGRLPQDGVDPLVYGYPSGIVGLRLFLNPDFFGKAPEAQKAREYWKKQVEGNSDKYYNDIAVHSDPKLVRPFRPAMACAFCHVGPHPLNPPADPENPRWENLSSIIGNQYWDPQPAFANLLKSDNFLYHFLKSQAPGTIDTSLVSTDQINNTATINAVFDVPARLERAMTKPTEAQGAESLLLPSLEDPGRTDNQRHFPMVLLPGEDSVGVFAALARVPLNIGVFSQEWARCDNPIIGFTPQRPFRVDVCRANSVYWNVNEKYRVGYMAKFFTLGAAHKVPKSTAPMKLKDAGPALGPDEKPILGANNRVETLGEKALAADPPEKRLQGREVFLNHCAICHSSKQPKGFDLRFQREMAGGWGALAVPKDPKRFVYTLPMDYTKWRDFKKSPAYSDYCEQIKQIAGPAPADDNDDPFLIDNFLGNELRIPVTLVGVYSGRAMATNAMRGQVWDNYSSETFKNLPSVGKIHYFNPFNRPKEKDSFGTNDTYDDGRATGGPGYCRPASLISLWATAPYIHNNALGIYTHDPSVAGRLAAFDDAIRRLLWPEKRADYRGPGDRHPGDLRGEASASSQDDPGYIYRLPEDTHVRFQPGFIRPLIEGIFIGYLGIALGKALFWLLSFGLWLILFLLFLALIFLGRARHAGIVLLLIALLGGLILVFASGLLGNIAAWIWPIIIVLAVIGFWLLLSRSQNLWLVRVIFIVFALLTLFTGIRLNSFLNGHGKGLNVGPIPRGTPVNLMMNLDPAKRDKLVPAIKALVGAMHRINQDHLTNEAAYKVMAEEAGPALMAASKVPDFVLDRGHWFGANLSDDPKENDAEKEALIAFLKTL